MTQREFILGNMLEAVKVVLEMGSAFPLDELVDAVRDEMLDTELGNGSHDWTIPQKFFMDMLTGVFDEMYSGETPLTIDQAIAKVMAQEQIFAQSVETVPGPAVASVPAGETILVVTRDE